MTEDSSENDVLCCVHGGTDKAELSLIIVEKLPSLTFAPPPHPMHPPCLLYFSTRGPHVLCMFVPWELCIPVYTVVEEAACLSRGLRSLYINTNRASKEAEAV